MKTDVQPLIDELHQAAAQYLQKKAVVPLAYQDFQSYLTTGNRLKFEQAYFARRRQLAVLALDYWQAPSAAGRQLLENVIWEVCNEYAWGLPAHLPITGETFGTASATTIDLFAAETGETLAEIQSLVGPDLAPMLNARIDLELQRRIFQPFAAHDWSWQHKANNWSAVIAGSLGLTALLKLPAGSSQLVEILARLQVAFDTYLGSFGADGACVEGVSYWAYGFGYYLYFAEAAARILGDQRYLQAPKVKQIAAFPALTQTTPGDYLPFSDYALTALPSGLLCYCHDQFGVAVPPVKQVSKIDDDECYRFAQLYRDLIWTKNIAATQPRPARTKHYFADVQWLVDRDDRTGFIFASKGGKNTESHNHEDVGHFILGDQQQLFLTDLGAGEYTKDYFNEPKRYNYFVTSARSHSLPRLNQQLPTVAMTAVSAQGAAAQEHVTYHLTSTYPPTAAVASFQRTFQADALRRQLKIQDDFKFEQAHNEVIENFITTIKPTQGAGYIALDGQSSFCRLAYPGTPTVEFATVNYTDHEGDRATAYHIRLSYPVATTSQLKFTFEIVAHDELHSK